MVLMVVAVALILTAMDVAELRQMRTRLHSVDPCRHWIPSHAINALLWWALFICWQGGWPLLVLTILLTARDAWQIYALVRAHRRGDHDDDDHPPRRRFAWRLRLNPRTGLPEPV